MDSGWRARERNTSVFNQLKIVDSPRKDAYVHNRFRAALFYLQNRMCMQQMPMDPQQPRILSQPPIRWRKQNCQDDHDHKHEVDP